MWADWLCARRDGNSLEGRQRTLALLGPVRDQVLDGASLGLGDVLVDVGCGDGMIGLGALERVGETGQVVFVDVSAALLDTCRAEVARRGLEDRAAFVEASAEDLTPLCDAGADAVTTRSVLIYVADKPRAFAAFRRVLRPGGRVSVWEPINAYGFPEPDHRFQGFDVAPVAVLATKVKQVYLRHQPPERSSMLNFDERDLVVWAEAAGFVDLHLTLEIRDRAPEAAMDWEAFLDSSPNPLAPTWREAITEALDSDEARAFLAHLRPVAQAGEGRWRHAVAHLVARVP
ncbi:MAG: arsenite methyltransferase [Solirubrobacteraceae bacterium]|nr:arsenite methyltransferase [Solirubrobacteraceae bacterium]